MPSSEPSIVVPRDHALAKAQLCGLHGWRSQCLRGVTTDGSRLAPPSREQQASTDCRSVGRVTIPAVEGSEASPGQAVELAAALREGDRLMREGDERGTEAPFRQADELGSARGARELAWVLRRRGAVREAEEAARRADARGDGRGALLLGLLLAWREEFAEAAAALGRAEERGDWAAAISLGVLLRDRGDEDGAAAALARAGTGRDGVELLGAGVQLVRMGDLDGAEIAWREAAALGNAESAYRLGSLLFDLEDLEGAEAAWLQADEAGDAASARRLGRLLAGRHEDVEAQAAFARAIERGNKEAVEDARLLSEGIRLVPRTNRERTESSMTLSPKAADAMADALRSPPPWLMLAVGVAPRFGQTAALRHAIRAAKKADPDGVVATGQQVDPYAIRNRAFVYARAAREDITAVRRIRALAGNDTTALRAAEKLVSTNDDAHHSAPIPDRAHRLIVAAVNNEPPKPATLEDKARFESRHTTS